MSIEVCINICPRVSVVFLFQNSLFNLKINYNFHKHFPQVNFRKVEFNQPSCQLYFVPNLLVI